MKVNSRVIPVAVALLSLGFSTSAATFQYSAELLGASESPPVPSPATGSALVTYDSTAHTLTVHVEFADLVGTTSTAHIHATTAVPFTGTAGVATYPGIFPGFPTGVTSGIYDGSWDLTQDSSYTAGFLGANGGTATGAESALYQALYSGQAYVNIHTSFRPGGEIRGFLHQVPDSGSAGLLFGIGFLTTIGFSRYSRK
jgi:hypothetical protein